MQCAILGFILDKKEKKKKEGLFFVVFYEEYSQNSQ